MLRLWMQPFANADRVQIGQKLNAASQDALMKITEIDIDRFRIWRSLLLKLNPTGLNVIYGPNEAGKTTLMRFVQSVLYGFEPLLEEPAWHRPEDDATLQIRLKWIMSKQVYPVKPETPLFNIVELKFKHDISCLPVVDVQGQMLGVVTTKDMLKGFLNNDLEEIGDTRRG